MCFSTRTECASCKGAKVIGEELPEFEVVSEHFLTELPVSELSPLFCDLAVHSDSDPIGAGGDPLLKGGKRASAESGSAPQALAFLGKNRRGWKHSRERREQVFQLGG